MALIHTHHSDLSSPGRERSQQHIHTRPATSRALTQPMTPLWAKPRKVVGSRPPPGANCYNSLPWQCSFPCIFFLCYISLPRILLLCLPFLSSHPGAPHVHYMHPLTPMLFLVILLDRGYPFSYFLVMGTYFYSQFSHTNYMSLLLIHSSLTFHDFLSFTQQNILHCSTTFLHLLSRPTLEYIL